MNEIPKFCGYYIDADTNHYNTFGQINGEWKDGVRYYIDINKKVTLEGNYLAEAMTNSSGDKLYEPIGSRIKKKLMNMVIFGSFSMVKSNTSSSTSTSTSTSTSGSNSTNEYGILLSGGIKISLDPKQDDTQSNVFYSNYLDIKNQLNDNGVISVGAMFGESSYYQLPGLDNESLRLLNDNPILFIQNYCKESNQDYTSFKQFIIKMHSIFNILQWSFEGKLMASPGLLLIIARAYYDINQVRTTGNSGGNCGIGSSKFEYFITLSCDLDGISSIFINIWEKNCIQVFMDHHYQKPMSLGFIACSFNPILFQQSFNSNNILESIVDAPFSSGGINQSYTGKSIDVVKSLLGSSDLNYIKSRSYIIPWINHYEPSNAALKKEIATFVNEQFIKELSTIVLLKGLNGIILYRDRGFEHDGNQLINFPNKIAPVTVNYDNSILQINSKQNQDITNQFLKSLNK